MPEKAPERARERRRARPPKRPGRPFLVLLRYCCYVVVRRLRARAALARPGHRVAGLLRGVPPLAPEGGERLGELVHGRASDAAVHAQAVLLGGLRGGRADTRDDGHVVRLARDPDQVADGRGRGEQDRVEAAALIAYRTGVGRRRRGAQAQSGCTVTSSTSGPSSSISPATRVSVAMSARGRNTRSIGSKTRIGRPVLQQPGGGLLAGGHQVRLHTKSTRAAAVCSPTAATLIPANARAVQPVLLELLPHRLDER
ncbi:hypothetical protein SMICM17S_03554 [Streptomyces microflavus]